RGRGGDHRARRQPERRGDGRAAMRPVPDILIAERMTEPAAAVRVGALPLSWGQEQLWRLWAAGDRSPRCLQLALGLSGALDAPALGEALAEVVRRQQVLHTTFSEDGAAPHARLAAEVPPPIPTIDLAALPAGLRAAEVARLAAALREQPFDLARGPLFRAALLRKAAREHRLLLTLHAAVADGASLPLLTAELAAAYGAAFWGLPGSLPEPRHQFHDVAAWRRERLPEAALAAQLAFCRERLDGARWQATLGLAGRVATVAEMERAADGGRDELPFALSGELARP